MLSLFCTALPVVAFVYGLYVYKVYDVIIGNCGILRELRLAGSCGVTYTLLGSATTSTVAARWVGSAFYYWEW